MVEIKIRSQSLKKDRWVAKLTAGLLNQQTLKKECDKKSKLLIKLFKAKIKLHQIIKKAQLLRILINRLNNYWWKINL
jgi:hypothetical protein